MQDGRQEIPMKATSSGIWKFHRKAEQESALCAAPVEHISARER